MNPVDHPHGGATAGGRPSCTPWGVYCKGQRTRGRNKWTNRYIITRAKGQPIFKCVCLGGGCLCCNDLMLNRYRCACSHHAHRNTVSSLTPSLSFTHQRFQNAKKWRAAVELEKKAKSGKKSATPAGPPAHLLGPQLPVWAREKAASSA